MLDGDNLLKIVNELSAKTEVKKTTMKSSNSDSWIQSDYSMKRSQTVRILALIRDSFWSSLWAEHVKTPHGAKHSKDDHEEGILKWKLALMRNSAPT